jgi:hypothetical protein
VSCDTDGSAPPAKGAIISAEIIRATVHPVERIADGTNSSALF